MAETQEIAVARPHIPYTDVPELIKWPCENCPNRVSVTARIKSDSLQIMDGELQIEGVWVPENIDPLSQRKVILVQLGKKVADLYAEGCTGSRIEEDWSPNHRVRLDYNRCKSESSDVLERLGRAMTPGWAGYYAFGMGLIREQIYTEPELAMLAAEKAKSKEEERRRRMRGPY